MKLKLFALAALTAMLAAVAARGSRVAADPFADTFAVSYTACASGGSCNGDGTIDAGEPVGLTIQTSLDAPNGSFYDAVQTVFSGVIPTGTVPAGETVGSGTFMVHVAASQPPVCSASSAVLSAPTYAFYATQDAPSGAWPGYANGLPITAGWIQDFDDDNGNNIPDYVEGGSGSSTLAMTVRDISPADGVPDGAEREPLYLPILDAIIGQTHDVRYFADIVIVPSAFEVPLDLVTYKNVPGAGQNLQIAVQDEGASLGLIPTDPSTATAQDCIPFSNSVNIDALSSGSHVIQTAAAGGAYSWQFQFSTEPDFDGDGIANYQDNCDTIANGPAEAGVPGVGNQLDTDGDGIGDACDTVALGTAGPTTADPSDLDHDSLNNWIDSCPAKPGIADSDGDGVVNTCDPAPAIQGDGHGYTGNPPLSDGYTDHDVLRTIDYTLPRAAGALPASVEALFQDSNDNHVADASENATTPLGTGIDPGDSDGDGTLDNADADPLDPNTNGARGTKCGTDCSFTTSGTTPPSSNNMVGDGCNDGDEATLAGFGAGPFDQWMFYDVPVPALFSAPSPKTTFRTSGVLSAGMAQAVFGYFKKAAKLGAVVYDQDLNQNNVMDGVEYDRSVTADAFAHAADGVIGAADAQKAFAQFKAGLKCNSGGYRLDDSTIP